MRKQWESHEKVFCSSPNWPSGRFGLVVAMSTRMYVFNLNFKKIWGFLLALRIWQDQPDSTTIGRINQAADRWQDQPGSKPLAGSTRQQTVGRINQAADLWDGDEDEDEDKDEDEDEH